MAMTFGSLLRANAGKHPDRTALVFGQERITYRALDERSNRLANALRARGVGRGDRVSLYMTNSPAYFEIFFALAKIGALPVPIGYRLTPKEMKHIAEHSESKALFCSDTLLDGLSGVRSDLEKLTGDLLISVGSSGTGEAVPYETLLQEGSPEDPQAEVNEDDLFYLAYTAGTTGSPKGALFTHRARILSLVQIVLEYGFNRKDRFLCPGPLYHAAPFAFSFAHLMMGATVVLMDHFEPGEVLRVIQNEKITTSFMVPTMYNMILSLPEAQKAKYDVSSVRVLVSAAAPLPTRLKEEILAFFPGAALHEFYGSTEVGIATSLPVNEQRDRVRSVGLPTYFCEVKVLDPSGREVPRGSEGLVYVRTPAVLKAYFKNPGATESSMLDGWFTNEDIGRLDEDGYLYLVDRKADMVISGGVNIYPAEIEDVLQTHPKILEAAVVGVPDPRWGEALLAFVVPRSGAEITLEEIVSFCEGKIARYKIPRKIQVVEELPKSPAGKVLKRVLREPFWKDQEARI